MHPRRGSGLLAPFALVLLLGGCNVFDADLYKGAAVDMSTDDGGASMGDMAKTVVPTLAVADRCTGDVPMLATSPQEFLVDTTSLADDISDVSACTGSVEPGNDGFFSINAQKGQRW